MSEIEKDSPSRELKTEWGNAMVKTLEDGNKVIYIGEKLFPPEEAREKLIDLLHVTHSSPEMQLWNATKLWFWPESRQDVMRKSEECKACQTYRPRKKRQQQPQLPIDTIRFNPGECSQINLYELEFHIYN